MTLTFNRLRELLHYDKDVGLFFWAVPRPGLYKGAQAGRIMRDGYVQIKVDYEFYLAHRLAWLYSYAEWPKHQIDHINRVRSDNRLVNLREATRSQQQGNTLVHKSSRSGIRGVRIYQGRWRAEIRIDGKKEYLGNFDTAEQAQAAYLTKAREVFGEYLHTGEIT